MVIIITPTYLRITAFSLPANQHVGITCSSTFTAENYPSNFLNTKVIVKAYDIKFLNVSNNIHDLSVFLPLQPIYWYCNTYVRM